VCLLEKLKTISALEVSPQIHWVSTRRVFLVFLSCICLESDSWGIFELGMLALKYQMVFLPDVINTNTVEA